MPQPAHADLPPPWSAGLAATGLDPTGQARRRELVQDLMGTVEASAPQLTPNVKIIAQ